MMNRLLRAGTAIAVLAGCSAAAAQTSTNAPAPSVAAKTAGVQTFVRFDRDSRKPINLGEAGHFVILSAAGITDVPPSPVVGNVGTSPITGAADHLTCAEVTGIVDSVDAAGPAPCSLVAPTILTKAVGNMQTAYTNAAARRPNITGLKRGDIGGLTLAPGVYKWSTDVDIAKDLVLKGDTESVWIFQIAQNLNLTDGTAVLLRGHALPQNVFWQVAGTVNMGSSSHMEGVILSKTMITMNTGASIHGRLYSQTAIVLEMNHVTSP